MTTKPTLLLQKDVFSEDENKNTEEIIKKFFNVKVVKDEDIYLGYTPKNYSGAFRGSLHLASRLGRKFPWADATQWAPAFRETLVSNNFLFLDAEGIIKETKEDKWPLFIRPTNGNKTFSGNVFTKDKFKQELDFLVKNKNGNPHTLCMFSQPKNIIREWRTIFVNNKFTSGSQYMLKGEKHLSKDLPEEIEKFAKSIIKNSTSNYFQNIFDFTLDIGEVKTGIEGGGRERERGRGGIGTNLSLIEVNGFETASFYEADLEKIYSAWQKSLNLEQEIEI